jgi:hypothetical protein
MLVSVYQTTYYHIPKNCNLHMKLIYSQCILIKLMNSFLMSSYLFLLSPVKYANVVNNPFSFTCVLTIPDMLETCRIWSSHSGDYLMFSFRSNNAV